MDKYYEINGMNASQLKIYLVISQPIQLFFEYSAEFSQIILFSIENRLSA